MLEIIIDSIIDSVRLLPFLFISYLVIEFIEHKSSNKINKALSNSGKYSKIVGGLLGLFPQCGFSAVAANLYAGRVITIGTLIAVFLSTSDEAIPMLLTYPNMSRNLILILVLKFVIAVIFGTIIDMLFRKTISSVKKEEIHEHMHEICDDCDCEHGIFRSALKHTLEVFIFVLIATFILNVCIEIIGTEMFEKLIFSGSIFQPFIASIIGIIPNCASSVLLTKLYAEGALSLGSIIAGLSTGAGIGGIVLLRINKNLKENLKIFGTIYIIGVFCGILIDLIGGLM